MASNWSRQKWISGDSNCENNISFWKSTSVQVGRQSSCFSPANRGGKTPRAAGSFAHIGPCSHTWEVSADRCHDAHRKREWRHDCFVGTPYAGKQGFDRKSTNAKDGRGPSRPATAACRRRLACPTGILQTRARFLGHLLPSRHELVATHHNLGRPGLSFEKRTTYERVRAPSQLLRICRYSSRWFASLMDELPRD